MTKYCIMLIALINSCTVFSQDLSFNHFFDNPVNINPALTGSFCNNNLVIGDMDAENSYLGIKNTFNIGTINKWSGSQSPYTSGFATYQWRKSSFNDNPNSYMPEVPLSIALTAVYDKTMFGVMKSTYFTISGAYNHSLAVNNDNSNMALGIGFAATYSNRVADLSNISFSEQFQSGGFDLSLPNGEYTMSNMKSYISYSSGLLFSLNNGSNMLRLGVSCFNLNQPNQSFYNGVDNKLPLRYSSNISLNHCIENGREFKYSYDLFSNYQLQSESKIFLIGGMLNRLFDDEYNSGKFSIGLGCNYQSNKTLTPCMRMQAHKYQVTATYDVLTDKESGELSKTKSYGIFFQYLF